MKDYLKILSKKGEVTILEHEGKTIVALKTSAGVVTLQSKRLDGTKSIVSKEQLLSELCSMCRNYPDQARIK